MVVLIMHNFQWVYESAGFFKSPFQSIQSVSNLDGTPDNIICYFVLEV